MLINWPIVVATYPGANDEHASRPAEIEGAWIALAHGLRGGDTGFDHIDVPDPARRFPDILTGQLIRHSKAGAVIGVLALLIGLFVFIASLRRVRRGLRDMCSSLATPDVAVAGQWKTSWAKRPGKALGARSPRTTVNRKT